MGLMESHSMSEPNLRQLKPVRLFDQVVEQLQALIVAGTWERGDRLPSEAELGVTYGVSRSVVREALRVLESKGLIDYLVQVEQLLFMLGPAAEAQQLLDDLLSPQTRPADLGKQFVGRLLVNDVLHRQLYIAEDNSQDVVEFMRDAA